MTNDDMRQAVLNLFINKTAGHVLVTGHSGSGKSTYAKRLAKETGKPVIHIDEAYPEWREFMRRDKEQHLQPNSPTRDEYLALRRSLVLRALATKVPSIIEGTQILGSSDLWDGHDVKLIDPAESTIVRRRMRRDRSKPERAPSMKPGSAFAKARAAKAKELIAGYRDDVAVVRNDPRVEVIKQAGANSVRAAKQLSQGWQARKSQELVSQLLALPVKQRAKAIAQYNASQGILGSPIISSKAPEVSPYFTKVSPKTNLGRQQRIDEIVYKRTQEAFDKLRDHDFAPWYRQYGTKYQQENDRLQQQFQRWLNRSRLLTNDIASEKWKNLNLKTLASGLPGNNKLVGTRYKGGNLHQMMELPVGDKIWYSPQAAVSSGYAADAMVRKRQIGGTPVLLRTTEDKLRQFGPIGPVTGHVASDNRGTTTSVTSKLRSLLGLKGYEQVATMPPRQQFIDAHEFFVPRSAKDPSAGWRQLPQHVLNPREISIASPLAAKTSQSQ